MFRTTPTSNADATLSSPATAKSKQKVFVLSALAAFLGLLGFSALGLAWFNSRYAVSDEMQVELKELSNVEYPANAALLSKDFQRYSNRKLSVIRRDDTHFDFVLEPTDENTAKIVIKNVDLSLMVPRAPEWVKQDAGLETIMFVNREWNRQQVSFPADSEHIEITGGDGFEKESIVEVALTNNCLNAGYWEVSLLTKEDNKKSLYYQGWFTFPMGHYKNVFETINNLPYWKHGWRLEHWQGPNGTVVPVESLRQVINEKVASAQFPTDERIIASGEQGRKVRVMLAKNLTTWQDFYTNSDEIKFAAFRAPGYYDPTKPWGNQYWKIGEFKKALLRDIKPVGVDQDLQEIELTFGDTKTGEENKLLVSGINLKDLPKLPVGKYPDGLYMPIGIGVPPFSQSYEQLESNHPDQSPYFSVFLDSEGRWIDHNRLAVAGVAMHLDAKKPNLVHLYLLSYERSTLIAHFQINL